MAPMPWEFMPIVAAVFAMGLWMALKPEQARDWGVRHDLFRSRARAERDALPTVLFRPLGIYFMILSGAALVYGIASHL